MTRRPLILLGSLCAVLLLSPLRAQTLGPLANQDAEGELYLAQMTATLEIEGMRSPISVISMPRGPLFSIQSVVERLGGELEIGPLGESHELELAGMSFRFGPESPVLTIGQEIVDLSQAPVAGLAGLQVPIDLLEAIYAELTGKQFTWLASQQRLVVGTTQLRRLPLAIDVVHLQGVSTVVLQFPVRPRYRIEQGAGQIRVHILGDRILPPSSVSRSREGLLRGFVFGEQDITLLLQPRAGMESYELSNPYRLVFDIFPGGPTAPTSRSPRLPPRRSSIPTIVLDPGHGGSDEGAQGNGLVEKDLTLRLARLLRSKLEEALPVRVVLTRDEDADLPLATRSAIANQLKADLFVSLHLNASFGGQATGAETYSLSLEASDERAQRAAEDANLNAGGDPLTDLQLILWDMAQSRHLAASQRLASLIQEELNETLSLRNRGVKQAPFSVLMGAAMPAVLVELGFLSNPQEVERLQDPLYQNELVAALTRALVRYRAAPTSTPATGTEVPE